MPGNRNGTWTEHEDRLLAEWQAVFGNRWSDVARKIPSKNGQQCAQRWRHRVNPDIKREKWSPEEDDMLESLFAHYGTSWAIIARCMPGRTDQQCMGRWRRHLDPSVRRESWRPAEDAQLFELAELYNNAWSTVCKGLVGRTSQQCRTRWHYLTGNPAAAEASRAANAASQCDPSPLQPGTKQAKATTKGGKRRGRPSKKAATTGGAAGGPGSGYNGSVQNVTKKPRGRPRKVNPGPQTYFEFYDDVEYDQQQEEEEEAVPAPLPHHRATASRMAVQTAAGGAAPGRTRSPIYSENEEEEEEEYEDEDDFYEQDAGASSDDEEYKPRGYGRKRQQKQATVQEVVPQREQVQVHEQDRVEEEQEVDEEVEEEHAHSPQEAYHQQDYHQHAHEDQHENEENFHTKPVCPSVAEQRGSGSGGEAREAGEATQAPLPPMPPHHATAAATAAAIAVPAHAPPAAAAAAAHEEDASEGDLLDDDYDPLLISVSRPNKRNSGSFQDPLGSSPLQGGSSHPGFLTPPESRRKRQRHSRLNAFGPSVPSDNNHHHHNIGAQSFFGGASPLGAFQGTHTFVTRNGGDGGTAGNVMTLPSPGLMDLLCSPREVQRTAAFANAQTGHGGGRAEEDNCGGGDPPALFYSPSPQAALNGLVTPEWARAARAVAHAADQIDEFRRYSNVASVARRLDVDAAMASCQHDAERRVSIAPPPHPSEIAVAVAAAAVAAVGTADDDFTPVPPPSITAPAPVGAGTGAGAAIPGSESASLEDSLSLQSPSRHRRTKTKSPSTAGGSISISAGGMPSAGGAGATGAAVPASVLSAPPQPTPLSAQSEFPTNVALTAGGLSATPMLSQGTTATTQNNTQTGLGLGGGAGFTTTTATNATNTINRPLVFEQQTPTMMTDMLPAGYGGGSIFGNGNPFQQQQHQGMNVSFVVPPSMAAYPHHQHNQNHQQGAFVLPGGAPAMHAMHAMPQTLAGYTSGAPGGAMPAVHGVMPSFHPLLMQQQHMAMATMVSRHPGEAFAGCASIPAAPFGGMCDGNKAAAMSVAAGNENGVAATHVGATPAVTAPAQPAAPLNSADVRMSLRALLESV